MVDAEFIPEYFHKKGAIAAARVADQINPQKRSSCSQFYIVQGRTYSNEELDMIEERSGVKIPQYQRDIYQSVGGTPFLDQNYTVFGEVIEGLDVVDKIASVRTGQGDWPVEDVRIIKIKKK
jgi:peptidyl-prolyl cis-trans isomerase B (cyclophilin B)